MGCFLKSVRMTLLILPRWLLTTMRFPSYAKLLVWQRKFLSLFRNLLIRASMFWLSSMSLSLVLLIRSHQFPSWKLVWMRLINLLKDFSRKGNHWMRPQQEKFMH